MKKIIASALLVAGALLPYTSAEAHRVHRPEAQPAAQEQQVIASATAEASTVVQPIDTVKPVESVANVKAVKYVEPAKAVEPVVKAENKAEAVKTVAKVERVQPIELKPQVEKLPKRWVKDEQEATDPFKLLDAPYEMRIGDTVSLVIDGFSEYNDKQFTVNPDGKLTIYPAGDIYVTGLTLKQASQVIAEKLSEYLINPKVIMTLNAMGYTQVYVLGEIGQGIVKLDRDNTLVAAIASVGGFTQKSAKTCVYVLHKNEPNRLISVDMTKLLTANNRGANPVLREGDIVYVSSNHKLGWANVVSHAFNLISGYKNIDDIRRRN